MSVPILGIVISTGLWNKIEPVIHAMRKGLNEPAFFAHFENLINKLNEHKKRKVNKPKR
jgi:hypothetical protein